MRGQRQAQATMLAFVDLEERVPRNHPSTTSTARRPMVARLRITSLSVLPPPTTASRLTRCCRAKCR
jgi:hypothetical protein